MNLPSGAITVPFNLSFKGQPYVMLKCRPKEHYKYPSISSFLNWLIIMMTLLMLSPLITT